MTNNEADIAAEDATDDHWETDGKAGFERRESLTIDVEGYEGPLDLLLELSRTQKVDLSKISILALAEQYLKFVDSAKRLKIELAADYLVMAAWLAYLKSKLLLPKDESDEEELSGEEMAAALAFRLQRLNAMREAGARLIGRNRCGRDFFVRGDPEQTVIDRKKEFSATLYDLLSAYATQRQRQAVTHVTIEKREVWSLQDAREILFDLIGDLVDWTPLEVFVSPYIQLPEMRKTVVASSFAATLELVREGKLSIQQDKAFAPLFLKTVAAKQGEKKHTGTA